MPNSRPKPDCLKPPKGASGSCGAPLMMTRPATICSAAFFAWPMSDENMGLEAVVGIICDHDGIVLVAIWNDNEDRPENLLARDPHVVAHTCEDRRADEPAPGEIIGPSIATRQERGAFFQPEPDIALHAIPLLPAHHRPDPHVAVGGIADPEGRSGLLQPHFDFFQPAFGGEDAGSGNAGLAAVREVNLNPDDRRLVLTLKLAQQLMGAPRHLGQHPGGFVLTHDRLDDLVPIEPATMKDRQIIEWDKDDVEALKFMKVDVLALGMLTCMAKTFDLIRDHKNDDLDLAKVPQEDPATYAMIRRADTLGTFQIESRAQMAMLPRLKPRTFYDLVVQVAIVRPGPIQGDMVHPYLRRREGREPVEYPTRELEAVLGKTLGVPLFQESAMRLAMVCAGFTGGEADQLRKSMATFKFTGGVSRFKEKLVSGMVRNGYSPESAEKTFFQLEGFGSYGFPESHAASFALIAYASNYVKCHYPDVFCTALLNSQPMGLSNRSPFVKTALAIRHPCRVAEQAARCK